MATELNNTPRPLYVDSMALKALIIKIGAMRESLREEMKHQKVEIDSSKFIAKEEFDSHVRNFNDFQKSTNEKFDGIYEILGQIVSVNDVENAYAKATTPTTPYELRTYDVYELQTSDVSALPETEDEMLSAISGRDATEETLLFCNGEPYAIGMKYIQSDYVKYITLEQPDAYGTGEVFVNKGLYGDSVDIYGKFYIYKLKNMITNVNIDEFNIDSGGQA